MKTFKYIGLFLVSLMLTFSCTEEDVDEVLKIDHTGGLINVLSSSLNYVVGDGADYPINLIAAHGSNAITSIDVYNTYTNSLGASSNTVLIRTVDLTQSLTQEPANFTVNYEELISGIVFDGGPLSPIDSELSIGDGFNLSYVAHLASGDTSESGSITKLTVSTRFAGKYTALDAVYYRIGVLTYTVADWPLFTTIESVDAKTYRVVEYFGAFNGNEWYFQVEPDLSITYPAEWDGVAQTGNTQPLITCALDAGNMTNVDCANSNFIELDNVDGKDKLYMTFGYLSPSGPREFYQVLEKIVD